MAKVARTTFAHNHVTFHAGQLVRDDDPAVKASPDMFVEPDEWLGIDAPVEQATAEPGEKRTVRRTRG